MNKRKRIDEVFTPRNSEVNKEMYVDRPELEKALYRSVLGSMHSFLFGESGNGKSWLYKKVFTEKSINYVIANCASASLKRSITDEIYSVCVDQVESIKKSFKETKTAGITAFGKAELSHQAEYEIPQQDKLLIAFESLKNKSSDKKSVIVFDNVETIFKNEALMNELCDIVILLDDQRYAKYGVKFLIVGVPNEVIQYFSSAKNPASVGNRIEEVQKVIGLDKDQVRDLVVRGFKKHLNILLTPNQIDKISQHIYQITLGVPQRIHEYCECLAYAIEDNNWNYDKALIAQANGAWLRKGLRESYTAINSYLNSEETSDGRRNQVIYALGKLPTHGYTTNQVGDVIAREFPNNNPLSNSGIGQILAYLSKGNNPILKKITNTKFYSICDPRHLMCIRIILYKDPETQEIKKKTFKLN